MNSEAHLQRLLDIATVRSYRDLKERDQLRTTLEASVDVEDLRSFLDSGSEENRKFLTKKDSLTGVPPLPVDGTVDLIPRLADRIYALRCRIVHAKDVRDGTIVEPMLPYSNESNQFGSDLMLIEYVCQKVIIAGSDETF